MINLVLDQQEEQANKPWVEVLEENKESWQTKVNNKGENYICYLCNYVVPLCNSDFMIAINCNDALVTSIYICGAMVIWY